MLRHERGFTFIELIVATVLTAMMLGAFGGTLYHFVAVPPEQADDVTATNELRFGLDCIEADGAHALSFTNATDPGPPFSDPPYYGYFSWIDTDPDTGTSEANIAAYRYDDGRLLREESINGAEPNSTAIVSRIAAPEDVAFAHDQGNNMVKVTITVTVDTENGNPATEIGIRNIEIGDGP